MRKHRKTLKRSEQISKYKKHCMNLLAFENCKYMKDLMQRYGKRSDSLYLLDTLVEISNVSGQGDAKHGKLHGLFFTSLNILNTWNEIRPSASISVL